MTQKERLTKEFQELDRVTPRPLDHEDYAIAAIQFANELFKDAHPSIMKQLEKAGDDYGKLIQCFEELDAIKKERDTLKNEYKEACYVIGKMSIENTNLEEENNRLVVIVSAQEKEIKEIEDEIDNPCGTEDELSKLVQRKDKLEEWLTEYRDQLKKENAFHKNTGIINAINDLLLDTE
jgi:chromosome segregation ATPase